MAATWELAARRGTLRFGNLEIDFEKRLVWRNSELVKLSPTEFSLLQELVLLLGRR